MAGGNCGVVPQQQVMHWRTYNLTAADHHRFFPGYGYTCSEAMNGN